MLKHIRVLPHENLSQILRSGQADMPRPLFDPSRIGLTAMPVSFYCSNINKFDVLFQMRFITVTIRLLSRDRRRLCHLTNEPLKEPVIGFEPTCPKILITSEVQSTTMRNRQKKVAGSGIEPE